MLKHRLLTAAILIPLVLFLILFMPNSHHLQDHPITGSPSLAWGVGRSELFLSWQYINQLNFTDHTLYK